MWDCGAPNLDLPGAGFPVLADAKHVTIYPATRETGAYNHHSQLVFHAERYWAMWSNHPHGEDGPGQRVMMSSSPDGENWLPLSEAFPRPTAVKKSEEMGLALTAIKWMAVEGRLFAVAECHDNIGFTDAAESLPPVPERRRPSHPRRARHGYAPLAREIRIDGSLGPIFALWDSTPDYIAFELCKPGGPSTPDGCPREGDPLLEGLRDRFTHPLGIPAWDFEGRLGFPKARDGHRLCEPAVYQRSSDGSFVMLLRDSRYSHRMFVSEKTHRSEPWPEAAPTDIPDSPSLSAVVSLPDGTVLLVGNQMAEAFDNPDGVKHYQRDPLMVSVSPDGRVFERAYALRCGTQEWRVPQSEVLGRGGGGQYPSALVHDRRLYVLYSMGKEDVAISSVPLDSLGL